MRTFLIDPEATSVTECMLPDKHGDVNSRDIVKVLNCKYMQWVTLMPHVLLIIDEEGYLKYNNHWAFTQSRFPFAGRGIMCGYDKETDTLLPIPSDTIAREVLQYIVWIGGDQALDRMIQRGVFERPKTELTADGVTEVIWEWKPNDKPTN